MVPQEPHTDGPNGVLWKEPAPGEFWRHFKGGIYQILAVAQVESTHDRVVVYKGDSGTWTRPLQEFIGNVSRDGYDGPRFAPVEVTYYRELTALRRLVRSMVEGVVGKTPYTPGRDDPHPWWGACGFVHGATLQELLKNLAAGSEDPNEYLDQLSAVEAALSEKS